MGYTTEYIAEQLGHMRLDQLIFFAEIAEATALDPQAVMAEYIARKKKEARTERRKLNRQRKKKWQRK